MGVHYPLLNCFVASRSTQAIPHINFVTLFVFNNPFAVQWDLLSRAYSRS